MLFSLKGRLYLLTLALILPCYVFLFLGFHFSCERTKDELKQMAQFVSQQAAMKQTEVVDHAYEFLTALSVSPNLQFPNSDACQRYIGEVAGLNTDYVNIGVPNANGILTCNGYLLDQAVDVSDRPYIRKALDEKVFAASQLQNDRVVSGKTINFAYPVFNKSSSSEVVGAAVVVVNLAWWESFLQSLALPADSVVYMFDKHGQHVSSNFNDVGFSLLEAFQPGVMHLGTDGKRRFFYKTVVDQHGVGPFKFIVGVSVEQSLAAIESYYLSLTLYFSLIVVIALIGSRYFFKRNVIKPFSTLLQLADKIGSNTSLIGLPSTGLQETDHLQDRLLAMAKRKQIVEQEVIKKSETDYLTGLDNRLSFDKHLQEVFSNIASDNQEKVALLYVDIDDFKEINDGYGHEIGDQALRTVATRLNDVFGSQGKVFRLAGDEFAVILTGQYTATSVFGLCRNMLEYLSMPIELNSRKVSLTNSTGFAIYPEDAEDRFELMIAADHAMHWAKSAGKNLIRRFDTELKIEVDERKFLVEDLKSAVASDQLFLEYQPIVDQQGLIQKFEALIRWQHPSRGLIRPDKFISIAEETGQINEIGVWIFEQVKLAIPQLQEKYGEHIQVSMNVSPQQFSNLTGESNDFTSLLFNYVVESRWKGPKNIIIEITENLLMNSDKRTKELLTSLRKAGYQLALDDFGTGYSSLSYILNYKIDYLKIDKSFVQQLQLKQDDPFPICEAIIKMAHKLGVAVVTEGVESDEQVKYLRAFNNDFYQGFLYSKPQRLGVLLDKNPVRRLDSISSIQPGA